VQSCEKLYDRDNVAFPENKKSDEAADADFVRLRDNTSLLELFAMLETSNPRDNINASETEDSDKVKEPDARIFSEGAANCDALPTFETKSS
jgi:hypothetical protein